MIIWQDNAAGSKGRDDVMSYTISRIERGYTLVRRDLDDRPVGPVFTYRGKDLEQVKVVADGLKAAR